MSKSQPTYDITVLENSIEERTRSLDLWWVLSQPLPLSISVLSPTQNSLSCRKQYDPCFIKTYSDPHSGPKVGLQMGDRQVEEIDPHTRTIRSRPGFILGELDKVPGEMRYDYSGTKYELLKAFLNAGFRHI